LIDDLISTGGSILKAVKAVREAGAEVIGTVAIFSYDLPESTKILPMQKQSFTH
jgi:Orotate phosphoribosyltransferase